MNSRHHLLLLLLSLLSSAGNFTALSQCSSLLRSFNSKLATWEPNTNCCNWEGVTCDDPLSGRITGLDLSNRSISGNISTTLFNLTWLRSLNLAYNRFDPIPIPHGFGNLYHLTSLNLSNAGFSGQIPIGIAKLAKLEVLDLSTYTDLVLEKPDFKTLIRNLSCLRELYLDGVDISASESEWSALVAKWTPNLRALSLIGCSISGPIDSSFSVLGNLSIIRLVWNELNCSLPEFFGNFSSLTEVWLSRSGLLGVFPESVFLLPNLTVVDLSSNELLSGSLPEFHDGSKLQTLKVWGTNFSGYLPDSIGKLKYLRTLDLSYSNFSGFIPSSIGNLTELLYLDFSVNGFSGEIPSVLPPRISNLQLGHNSLNGSIPSSFGNLQQLVQLDLSRNSLTGRIPASLFSLPLLQTLNLKSNKLLGEIQEFPTGSASQLGFLDLSSNLLQGEIPRSVFRLADLKHLNLASNNFSGVVEISWLSELLNLSSLDLSYNSISIKDIDGNDSISFPNINSLTFISCNLTRVPRFLRNLEQVSSLDLSNNKIFGAIPNWIWSIGKNSLSYLNLSYNLFSSLPTNLIVSPVSVSVLDLNSNLLQGPIPLPPINAILLDYSNNHLSSFIPSNLSLYLTETVSLSLSNNSLSGEIPPSICNATKLQFLDFSRNNLSGQIPQCLLDGSINPGLGVLNLGRNRIDGRIPQTISNNCPLQTLNLNNNNLEGSLPRSLTNCNYLEVLDVGNNHLHGSFPFWLGKIPSLQVLVLRSNEFYGPVGPPIALDAIYSFPLLQIFDISSNKFNGILPTEYFKNLKAMMVNSASNRSSIEFSYSLINYQESVTITIKGLEMELAKTLTLFTLLDFSNNGFEGSIPEVIGELKSLIMLNFSHNELTGVIPKSLANLTQLESLDLSSNYLSGNIPPELTNLTFLEFLGLSDNSLSGTIPQGRQFSTFSNTSYKGNRGLCGIPLTKQCSNQEPPPKSVLPSLETHSHVDWHFLSVELGFVTGLAVLFGTLIFCEKVRKWYFHKVDTIILAVCPSRFRHIFHY